MKKFLLALGALTVLVSCGGNTDEPKQEESVLTVTTKSLSFDSNGGTQTVNVVSSIDPSINCKDSWLTVTKGEYQDKNVQLTIVAAANATTAARKGTVSVNGDKKTINIEVTQGVNEYPLEVDKSSISFTYAGGGEKVVSSSTSEVSITGGADWCTATAGKQADDRKTEITVLAGPNLSGASRNTSFTIKCGNESKTVDVKQPALGTISTAAATALTQDAVYDKLKMGWNLGNQMEANSNGVAGETIWGNKKTTQAAFNAVKAAGYSSVRIPVTYLGHIGDAPAYVLETKWLDRVAEIVGYAENAGLNAIINIHHDGADSNYWLNIKDAVSNSAKNTAIKLEIFAIWNQIAERFKDKGDFLIFESFNEIHDGGWGWSDAFKANPNAQYKILNEWNQVFVDAVRATGGNNAARILGVPGYCASPAFTIAGFQMPEGYTSGNRILVAVHDYDPYDYTLNKDEKGNCKYDQWGHTAQAGKAPSEKEESLVKTFEDLLAAFPAKGMPLYLGEMGCSNHSGEIGVAFQKYYLEYFCKAVADRKIPFFLWDNGAAGTGPETMGYINHADGTFVSDNTKMFVETMAKAVTTTDPAYTLESVYNTAPVF